MKTGIRIALLGSIFAALLGCGVKAPPLPPERDITPTPSPTRSP